MKILVIDEWVWMLQLWTNVAQTMQDIGQPVLTMSLPRASFRPTALHAYDSLLPSQRFSTLPARLRNQGPPNPPRKP